MVVSFSLANAQNNPALVTRADISKYNIPLNNTTHIISPEPISYVDISSPNVEGDLTDKKICRIRPLTLKEGESFTVTVVSKSFLIVYELTCAPPKSNTETFVITINPMAAVQLNEPDYLKDADFKKLSVQALATKRTVFNLQSNAYDLNLWINNIFIVGDYLLFDIGLKNKSKLSFDIDQVRFVLKDKKVLKATISQDIEMEPAFAFYDNESSKVKSGFRNFYFFKKFTFPTDKVLSIEFTEEQISGRKIVLDIDYSQVLQASVL